MLTMLLEISPFEFWYSLIDTIVTPVGDLAIARLMLSITFCAIFEISIVFILIGYEANVHKKPVGKKPTGEILFNLHSPRLLPRIPLLPQSYRCIAGFPYRIYFLNRSSC